MPALVQLLSSSLLNSAFPVSRFMAQFIDERKTKRTIYTSFNARYYQAGDHCSTSGGALLCPGTVGSGGDTGARGARSILNISESRSHHQDSA